MQTNWVITKINEPVFFKKGTPFLFFTIYDSSLLPSVEFDIHNRWDFPEIVAERKEYNDLKIKNSAEKPWTWLKGLRTGKNAKGEQVGVKYPGLPKLASPMTRVDE